MGLILDLETGTPGSPSLTRTVVVLIRNPQRSTANRCRVRYGNHASLPGEQLGDLHHRQRRLAIAAGHPPGDLLLPGEQQLARRAVPVRANRADRATTAPISSSLSASTPASRPRPSASAAAT